MRRRRFLTNTAQALAVFGWPSLIKARQGAGESHNVVLINLRGGVDHNLFAPIFSSPSSSQLTKHIYWPYDQLMMAGDLPVLASPILYPGHPVIERHGERMAFIHGVSMDNQQGHTFATKLLVTGSGQYHFAQILGELLGHDTQYGLVSTGVLDYRSPGLSAKAQGIEVQQRAETAAAAFGSLLQAGILPGRSLDDFAAEYYKDSPHPSLVYSQNIGFQDHPHLDSSRAMEFGARVSAEQKDRHRLSFVIPETIASQYQGVAPAGIDRHRYQGLGFAAARIREGGFARVFNVNLGAISGDQSYDSHDFPEGNLAWQTRFLAADFAAVGVFLDQIASELPNTTVIMQSEFGRPPYFTKPTSSQGKDHFPECNLFTVFSPLVKNGLHGNVDPKTGEARSVQLTSGSSVVGCGHFYRGLLEVMREKGLFNGSESVVEEVMRQYLPIPYPRGFYHV